jgi:type I restriction enzyme, S subunit
MKNWELKKIGDVCKFVGGSQPPKTDFSYEKKENHIRLIQIRDYKSDNHIVYIPKTKARRFCNSSDIMIGRYGPPVFQILRGLEGAYNVALMKAVPNEKVLSKEYLYIFLKYSKIQDYIIHLSQRAAGQSGVNKEAIEDYLVSLPPLPEQQRIVAILDEAFSGIATATANAEQNLANARELFESALQAIYTQKENNWVEKKLADICDIKHGFAFDGKDFETCTDTNKPIVLTPGNFTEYGVLSFTDKNTKRYSGNKPTNFTFKNGDLVVVMTDLSSKMKILGRPALIGCENVLHNQRIGRLIFKNNSLATKFLYYFFMTYDYLGCIRQSATGTMVKHTAPKRILENKICFPSDLSEQLIIVAKLDDLSTETKKLEDIYQQKLKALDELKKSILHQAFSGQL